MVIDIGRTQAAIEDDRLVNALVEAHREMFAFRCELDQLTVKCLYKSHWKLVQAAKAAEDKCVGILLALRTHRNKARNKAVRKLPHQPFESRVSRRA